MERKTIFFNAKVKPVKPVNQEFTLCKVYVCALDKNRNFSYIGKDAADEALATLYNCPVVGHLYEDEQGNYHMGGHDMVIAQDKDGSYYFKSLCVPYGVIPQQEDVHYEEIEESDGRGKKTYVVADCILWTGRYPELKEAIYSEDCWFGQSMEIGIKEHEPLEEDKNYTNILKYSYSALCLLGKSDTPEYQVEPCFPESKIGPYEFALNNAQFTELMVQLKQELTLCFAHSGKGGESMNENATVVTEQVDTTEVFEDAADCTQTPENEAEVADVPAEVEEHSVEETIATDIPESFEETHTDAVEQPATFSSTYREKREAIDKALPRILETDEDGVVHDVYCCICDFDDTHVFVEKFEYTRGNSYTETKGRYAYTFDDTNKTAAVSGNFEEMFVKWLTKDELSQLDTMRAQYEVLVRYRAEREKQDHESAIDVALEEFSDLEGNEMFADIVGKKYSYNSVEALKDACYIVRGKYSVSAKSHKASADPIVPIVGVKIETQQPTIYDEFFARYGPKKTSR